jgi:hypothetical protein
MPFIPKPPYDRPLSEALDFIRKADGCSRAEAFVQFRLMAMSRIANRPVVDCLWGDPRPPARANIGVTKSSENVGPFPSQWKDATLEDDGRVRFGTAGPVRSILVPWSWFLVMWQYHQEPSRAPAVTYSMTDTESEQAGDNGSPSMRTGTLVRLQLEGAVRIALESLGSPGKEIPWKRFCDHVRRECEVTAATRGYGDRSIERAVTAIKTGQDKSDKPDRSDMSQTS